jgi:single-stranded-DNA-specific exonuclease
MQTEILIRSLLEKRGISIEDEEAFLNPSYETHDPFLMSDMRRAVDRIFKAISEDQHITIYSDYDCDGIPGGVVLHDFFKKINYYNFDNYIPDRASEGYGLNKEAIDQISDHKTSLIITVDLGITAVDEVLYAKEKKIDVIITDHHLPHDQLPKAYAILNPKKIDDNYPFKELCGAGVAFKLVQAMIVDSQASKLSLPDGSIVSVPFGWEKWLLDMVSLATLSDMVPLVGENRIFARFGLLVIQKTKRPGLVSLFKKLKIDQRYVSEDDIGFMVAPRLNAASRMDSPHRAFELLSTTDWVMAKTLSDHLSKINDERKKIVATIMRDVNKHLDKREIKDVIVIGNPNWRAGILGLVASKITEKYHKPSFVWGSDGDENIIKGSCRSEGDINVVDLMSHSEDALISFGGHECAGGFATNKEKVHLLENALNKAYPLLKKEGEIKKVTFLDRELNLDLVDSSFEKILSKLSPHGIGNPKPTFVFQKVNIDSVRNFGKDESHLELIVSSGSSRKKAISFFKNKDSFKGAILKDQSVDLIATIERSRFLGREELRLRIIDIL